MRARRLLTDSVTDVRSFVTCTYRSVFGAIGIQRAYYHAVGSPGVFSLDAELNLPERGCSYVVQEFSSRLPVAMSYADSPGFLSSFFPLKMPIRSLERIVGDVCEDVDKFYDEKTPSNMSTEGVVSDATVHKKRVVIRKAGENETRPANVSDNPDKPGKKRMATVISPYVTPRHVRTTDDIVGEISGGKALILSPSPGPR
ncbi:MAG: hypothetical protein RDU20_09285 [Desulfomonilaceae bacterium]|nr:hypothetical protein [Desulfomonilaceae bacterium]